MLALPISKPRFKRIIFNQNNPKIKLFLQKNAKFLPPNPNPRLGFAPNPQRLRPQTPKTAPPLRISGYAPKSHNRYVLFVCCRPAPNSGQKIGLSLSEDLFFLPLQQKIGLNLCATISYSDLCSFQIF